MHLAVGWQRGQREPWLILSDEPTDRDTLAEYGQRFRIEENFWTTNPTASNWKAPNCAMPAP